MKLSVHQAQGLAYEENVRPGVTRRGVLGGAAALGWLPAPPDARRVRFAGPTDLGNARFARAELV